jgi:hypothetical protein
MMNHAPGTHITRSETRAMMELESSIVGVGCGNVCKRQGGKEYDDGIPTGLKDYLRFYLLRTLENNELRFRDNISELSCYLYTRAFIFGLTCCSGCLMSEQPRASRQDIDFG